MPVNTTPIFSRIGSLGQSDTLPILTANTTKTLTSGTIYLVFTADANFGSRVNKLILQPIGTNIATVARIWINNGSTTGTATNNTMIKDVTMAATTNSETAAIGNTEVVMDVALPASWRIYITLGTVVAAGFNCAVVAGNY